MDFLKRAVTNSLTLMLVGGLALVGLYGATHSLVLRLACVALTFVGFAALAWRDARGRRPRTPKQDMSNQ